VEKSALRREISRDSLTSHQGIPYGDEMRADKEHESAVPRRIVGFHLDEENHWVADLECGHSQHVRHDPPWQRRAWVTTETGRKEFIGQALMCVECGRTK